MVTSRLVAFEIEFTCDLGMTGTVMLIIKKAHQPTYMILDQRFETRSGKVLKC